MYIEQKTSGNRSLADRGPAEIGEVTFSKTGHTVYYRGLTFHRAKGRYGAYGNYYCEQTGDEYWISGVKKRHSNRRAGGGAVIDRRPKADPGPR
jgi:hypothetical protein